MEIYLSNLGEAIRNIRWELSINQSELADGICTQSQISKIESGVISPYVHTLVLIANKLGISPIYFINELTKEQFKFVSFVRDKVRDAVKNKQYERLKKLLNYYQEHNALKHLEERQFLLWHQGIVEGYCHNNREKALAILMESSNMKKSIQYTEQDIQILNSIGIIFCEENRWNEAIDYFIKAEQLFSSHVYIQDRTIYNKLCYNTSKAYLGAGIFAEAIKYSTKGIKQCISIDSTYMLGELYYQRAYTKMQVHDITIDDVIADYNRAFHLFLAIDKELYAQKAKEKIDSLREE